MFGRIRIPSARPSSMFRTDRPVAWISSSLVLYRVLAVVLSLWHRDRNRMDSYRVSTVDVPECLTTSGARGPWRSNSVISCIAMKNDGVLLDLKISRMCNTYFKWRIYCSSGTSSSLYYSCRHMFHALPENILVYYDIVPLQFWSRNVALVL